MKVSNAILVRCSRCGRAEKFPATSPAAPMLSALEFAETKGWAYQVGFFSMLTGDHNPVCPECMKRKEHDDEV